MPRENKMARTKLLTNIIQRKMMLLDEMSHSNQHQNFEISLYDFAQHEILEKLYKADNQRSTECWSPDETPTLAIVTNIIYIKLYKLLCI